MTRSGRRPLGAAAALCAILVALLGAPEPASAVICVGLDGHTARELLATGCCAPNADSPATEAAVGVAISAPPACGSCVDIALASPIVPRERSDNRDIELGPDRADLDVLPATVAPRTLPRTNADPDADLRPQILVLLATVALLI